MNRTYKYDKFLFPQIIFQNVVIKFFSSHSLGRKEEKTRELFNDIFRQLLSTSTFDNDRYYIKAVVVESRSRKKGTALNCTTVALFVHYSVHRPLSPLCLTPAHSLSAIPNPAYLTRLTRARGERHQRYVALKL